MSLFPSLFVGLILGLQSNTLTKYSSDEGVTTLFDADFTTPTTSWTSGRTGFSSAYADTEWQFQTYSSGYAADTGSGTLTNTGGLTGQTAVGVWDGSYTGRNAWEVQSANDYLECSNTTACDSNNEDFCFRLVFRSYEDFTNGQYLLSKRLTNGWLLYQQSNTLRFFISDGTNTVNLSAPSAIAEGSGALNYVTGWYDYSADMLYMKSNLFSEVSASTASVTGTLSNSQSFVVGNRGDTHNAGVVGTQFLAFSHCAGASAQSMYDEDFWNHAKDPTGLLTTATRASMISVPVADGYVAHFGDDQLPIGYHSAFSHTSKLGLYCNSATTNLIAYSEDFTGTGWSTSLATDTADQASAPDGFYKATDLAGGFGAGKIQYTVSGLTGGETYTASIWVKRNWATDVACELRIVDSAAPATFTTSFDATSTWQRIEVSGALDGASTSFRFELGIPSNQDVFIWGAQLELGDGATAYIRTNGATASLAAPSYAVSGTAGQYVKGSKGEILVNQVSAVTADSTVYYVSCWSSGNTGLRSVRQNGSGSYSALVYSAASTLVASETDGSVTPGTEQPLKLRWDDAAGLSVGGPSGVEFIGDSNPPGSLDPDTWTSADDITDINIGSYRALGTQTVDAWISRITIYDQENV